MAEPRSHRRGTISSVVVVVPARNEEARILACLEHLQRSIQRLGMLHPGIPVRVHVVLDGCTDATAVLIASGFGNACWLRTHPVTLANVGKARAFGVERALSESQASPQATLVACTDADSVVPPGWLTGLVGFLDRGFDAVLGTVRPTPGGLGPGTERAWRAGYRSEEGHGHVHGANLGVRASTYLRAGGFPPLESGEDVHLAARLESCDARVVRTASLCVTTSSRLLGRAPGGFAAFLSEVDPSSGHARPLPVPDSAPLFDRSGSLTGEPPAMR